jgi:hypothetical protein
VATISGASEARASLSTIINFYGEGSMFTGDDSAALTNHRMPVYPPAIAPIPSPDDFIPPHAFKTFCHIVAACGTDPVLDGLCDRAFPDGQRRMRTLRAAEDPGRGNGNGVEITSAQRWSPSAAPKTPHDGNASRKGGWDRAAIRVPSSEVIHMKRIERSQIIEAESLKFEGISPQISDPRPDLLNSRNLNGKPPGFISHPVTD